MLGHDIGAPRVLDHYADILKYYRALAAKSKRVKIIETGATEEGRPTVIVLISADENIANLEVNRQNLVKLGDPRGLTEEQAKDLITQDETDLFTAGRPAFGGNRAAGNAHGAGLSAGDGRQPADRQHPPTTSLSESIRPRDPDGRDRYTDWYYRNKIDDTDDLNPVPGAPYWGKYIFHDNNRDINYTGLQCSEFTGFLPAVASADHARPA